MKEVRTAQLSNGLVVSTLKPTDFHLDASPASAWIRSQEDILPSNENCRNQVVFAAKSFSFNLMVETGRTVNQQSATMSRDAFKL